MLETYAMIPLAALLIYTLMFCMFIAARKNRLLNSFTTLLFFLMLWSAGSFLMRIQFLGVIKIWFHLSLAGIWMACISIDVFLCYFVDKKLTKAELIMHVLVVLLLIANDFSDWFLAAPVLLTQADGAIHFVYTTITVGTYIMYALLAGLGAALVIRVIGCAHANNVTRAQFIPMVIGVVTMLVGNFIILLPPFAGIPLDIVAGVVFAVCIFFTLYFKHLFSLTLAFSRRTYTIVTAGILLLLAIQFIIPAEEWLRTLDEPFGSNSIIIVSIGTAACAAIIYFLVQRLSENVFLGDYNSRSESLELFHDKISKSLRIDEICKLYCEQIIGTMPCVDSVRVCERRSNGAMVISGSSELLETGRLVLEPGSAVVAWIMKHRYILTPSEFARSVEYRAMWESEKRSLDTLHADYFIPMFDSEELLGVTVISMRNPQRSLHADEVDYLLSLNTVTAVSLKNSKLYQKALHDAQTDDLTGLLNRKRFLEVLNETYTKNPSSMLSLMVLNIDDFKLYNQLYGVREGDAALKKVADILRSTVGKQNYVSRYSGKVFSILLPGQEPSAAGRLAENLRQQIFDINRLSGDDTERLKILTASIGICSIPFGACNVKQLLDNADMAVFQAKHHGKNGVMIYSVGMVGEPLETERIDHKNVYSAYENTIIALCAAIDAKDHYTFTHSGNVAYYATQLAKVYGLNSDTVEIVRESALLHDVGKIGIPESVLNKPGRLTGDEYEIIKHHPENAVAIIKHLPSLDYVIPAVLGHHERWDGKGYPRRLGGEDIPLNARILCVADCFDAITSRRCYQDAKSVERALNILEVNAGSQFDPTLVRLFVSAFRDGTIKLNAPLVSVPEYAEARK